MVSVVAFTFCILSYVRRKGREMIVKGKFVKDWDKSKISTAYQRPNKFRIITWDMGRIQGWLLGQKPLARNLIEKVIR
jgi:pantothenate kinase-related protein Tda10